MSGSSRQDHLAALPARVLITGGAGFVGSHVADALLACGSSVVALDDLSTGRLENVRHLSGNPGFAIEVGSAADPVTVQSLLAECDACVHLAAVVGVKLVLREPARALEVNSRCTEAVVGGGRSTGCAGAAGVELGGVRAARTDASVRSGGPGHCRPR